MGMWGYLPDDGDGAQDLYGGIQGKINNIIKEKTELKKRDTADDIYDKAGLILTALVNDIYLKPSLVKRAMDYIKIAINDKEFMSRWKSPIVAERVIGNLWHILNDIYTDNKGESFCIVGPKEFDAIKKIRK